MHPAVSVIIFTVFSGAGFGSIFWIGAGLPLRNGLATAIAVCLVAGSLAVAGLLASTFHLGHPERAWRAFSQWRTSWLSREGVLAVACLMLFGLYALVWWTTGKRMLTIGIPVALLAAATVFATAMIYAQLKTVPLWNRPLTPAVYLAFAAESGLLTIGGFAQTDHVPEVAMAAMAVHVIAWGFKGAWWAQASQATLAKRGSTRETATGLGHLGKVRLFERPHSGENYLTREMVHVIGRKHADKLRFIAMAIGGVVPLMLMIGLALLGWPQALFVVAPPALMAGLFVERWLFFAEAVHSVSLYYDESRP